MEQILGDFLAAVAHAKDLTDVNIAAGIAAQELESRRGSVTTLTAAASEAAAA